MQAGGWSAHTIKIIVLSFAVARLSGEVEHGKVELKNSLLL